MKEFKERFYGNILRNRIKKFVSHFADNIEDRMNNKLREGLSYMGIIINSTKSVNAQLIFKDYLERRNEVRIITERFVNFYLNVSSTQLKMKVILNRKAGRFKIISEHWEKEIQNFFLGRCLTNKNNKNFRYFK